MPQSDIDSYSSQGRATDSRGIRGPLQPAVPQELYPSDREPLPNLCTTTMTYSSDKIEAISTVLDEKLNSISQLDRSALDRGLSRKPTYEAYKTLLAYRHTLISLNANVDLRVEQADDALSKTSEDISNTATALVNACNSTASSPSQTARPALIREALSGTMKLQMLYQREKANALVDCRCEQMQAQMHLQAVTRRVEEVERALVKKYEIHAIADEGRPLLNEHNVERMIDVMASVPGIEDLEG